MNHRLIEPRSNERRDVLPPEHLPDASPCSAGFTHLGADRLDVIVVLGQKTSQVLKHLDSLENVASHQKLLPKANADATAVSRCCFRSTPTWHS